MICESVKRILAVVRLARGNSGSAVEVVAADVAQLRHRRIESMVEINECVFRPETLAQLFARHHVLWTLQQRDQHLKRLQLQFEPRAVPAQLCGLKIGIKVGEAVFGNSSHAGTLEV